MSKPDKGLMLEIEMGKGKPPMGDKPKSPFGPLAGDSDDEGDEDMAGEFDSAAEEAFHAAQEGDIEGYKAALKLAIKACNEEY